MDQISRREYARRVMSNPTDYYIWTRHLADSVSREGLSIRYFGDTDTLLFHIAESTGLGETVAPYLWVMYGRDGEVSSVTIDHASKHLGPYLFPDDEQIGKSNLFSQFRDMAISYSSESDTLRLQTGEPPYIGYTEKAVAPGLCVNFDPEGWAMGVTIEQAAELLRPYLLAESAGVA